MNLRMHQWRKAILAGGWMLLAGQAEPAWATYCATVKLEVLQEMSFERQAFEARMRISNGLPNSKLDHVQID